MLYVFEALGAVGLILIIAGLLSRKPCVLPRTKVRGLFGFSGDRKWEVAEQLPQPRGCGLAPFSVLTKEKQKTAQYSLFALGGIFLIFYSIHLKNVIFIILQATFTLAAIYALIKVYRR